MSVLLLGGRWSVVCGRMSLVPRRPPRCLAESPFGSGPAGGGDQGPAPRGTGAEAGVLRGILQPEVLPLEALRSCPRAPRGRHVPSGLSSHRGCRAWRSCPRAPRGRHVPPGFSSRRGRRRSRVGAGPRHPLEGQKDMAIRGAPRGRRPAAASWLRVVHQVPTAFRGRGRAEEILAAAPPCSGRAFDYGAGDEGVSGLLGYATQPTRARHVKVPPLHVVLDV